MNPDNTSRPSGRKPKERTVKSIDKLGRVRLMTPAEERSRRKSIKTVIRDRAGEFSAVSAS